MLQLLRKPTTLAHWWPITRILPGIVAPWVCSMMALCLKKSRGQNTSCCQWPFQDPKLEVPTIYLPYIRPIFQAYVREYHQKIWPYMVQYLHFRILNFPLMLGCFFPIPAHQLSGFPFESAWRTKFLEV